MLCTCARRFVFAMRLFTRFPPFAGTLPSRFRGGCCISESPVWSAMSDLFGGNAADRGCREVFSQLGHDRHSTFGFRNLATHANDDSVRFDVTVAYREDDFRGGA